MNKLKINLGPNHERNRWKRDEKVIRKAGISTIQLISDLTQKKTNPKSVPIIK